MAEFPLGNDKTRTLWVVYSGRSMNPTLMEHLLIEVIAIQANEIRKVDLIAFHLQE